METQKHELLINNMLDFDSISDEIMFIENIEKGNFVILLVRKRHCERCYKYKMFSPFHPTGAWEHKKPILFSGDIYKNVEHAKKGDLGVYCSSYWFRVEKIMKIYTLEQIQEGKLHIAKAYIEGERNDKVKEILISIKE